MIDIKTSYKTFSYQSPVPVRCKTISSNAFLKVTVLEQNYFFSVLPGMHNSTLLEIEFALVKFFSTHQLDFSEIKLHVPFFNMVEINTPVPNGELLFCIETILLGLIRTTHPETFNLGPIKLSALYTSVKGPAFYADTECIKIKINPTNSNEVAAIMTELSTLNSHLKFRLDGNKRFELDELFLFVENLESKMSEAIIQQIDYIEEPFKNFYDTYTFESRSNLLLAMDESYPAFMKYEPIKARPVVIKPSLIGISPVKFWLGSNPTSRAIVSSTFEHPTVSIGHQMLANLRPEEFHGLESFL